MKRWLYAILLLSVTLLVNGQDCANCTIGVPTLAEPQTVGEPTIFEISNTGLAMDCLNPVINPRWAVTGDASIISGANSSTVTVSAFGAYDLILTYDDMMGSESCTMVTAENVAVNPDLVSDCGLDVIIVLDESNSISNPEEEGVRDAVRNFVNGLEGTGSNLAIVEFGTRAEAEILNGCNLNNEGSPNYMEITNSSIDGCIETYLVNDYGITTSGGTNWDDALLKVQDVINSNAIQPDIVIFFTDGNPTYYIDEVYNNILGGSGSVTMNGSVNHAIVQANRVKQTAHILVIGVGDAINEENIKMISGIDGDNDGDLMTQDYVIAEDFDLLYNYFLDVALSICGTDVALSKTGPGCFAQSDPVIEYEVSFINEGDQPARNVLITDVMPDGYEVVSQVRNPVVGSVSNVGNVYTWDYGPLGVGEGATWTFSVQVAPNSGASTNLAYISASNIQAEFDDTARVITLANEIDISVEITDNSCGPVNSGLIDIAVAGGAEPYEFNWSNGSITEDIDGLSAGVYNVVVTDHSGCIAEREFEVGLAELINVIIPVEAPITEGCSESTVLLTAADGFDSYQWMFEGEPIPGANSISLEASGSGQYYVLVQNPDICVEGSSEPIAVTFYPPIEIELNQSGTILCAGAGNIQLWTEAGYSSYSWYHENELLEGQDWNTIDVAVPGTYTVFVTDDAGCSASAFVEVMGLDYDPQNESIMITMDHIGDSLICIESEIAGFLSNQELTISVCRDPGNISYNYSLIGSSICFDITRTHTNASMDTLCILVCDNSNCGFCDTIHVYIESPAIGQQVIELDACIEIDAGEPVIFSVTDIEELPNDEFYFSDILVAPGSGAVIITDDGQSFQYDRIEAECGQYVFTMELCGAGYPDCHQVEFCMNVPCEWFVPDVITPNDDGLNEVFYLNFPRDAGSVSLRVFNRWGSEVYRNDNYNNDWKGTYQGSPLPDGTYFFVIYFTNQNGNVIDISGDLTILR